MTPSQKAALMELSQKSLQDINTETAQTWAYRAWAAARLASLTQGETREKFLHDQTDYEHEAIEHGALAGDDVLAAVRRIIAGE